ncbi:MAG: hypothetical protein WCQ50_01765 [Spirochaetota bacterium]
MNPEGIGLFSLYDAARGPLFLVACLVFILGFAWRILRFARLSCAIPARGTVAGPGTKRDGVPLDSTRFASAATQDRTKADEAFLLSGKGLIDRVFFRTGRFLRTSNLPGNPAMTSFSLAFHFLLLLVPLLLPAHNILLFLGLGLGAGLSLPVLPEPLMDQLTLVILAIGLFFALRRIFLPRVRALTTGGDLVVLLLVAAPFVSAYLAYHQAWDYHGILVTHMLLGELLIAAIPFTKLGHMPFLLFSRLFMAGERSARHAGRRWAA